MEKRISYSQFQQVKSAAKMIDPLKRKMQPLEEKINALIAEYKGYQTQVDALEEGIVKVIGFHVGDLVKKVIEPTDKTDANGKPIKVTKYVETSMVSYDKEKKQYVITLPDEATPLQSQEAPATSSTSQPTDSPADSNDSILD